MSTTIIYAHPYEKSFNHAIFEKVIEKLEAKSETYQVLDLYQDGFNPVYTKEELALFNQGKALDPLVKNYQAAIQDSNRLIFIFPVWWYDAPSIVKGFFDKVFLKNLAYEETSSGLLKGLFTNIEEALIISTSAAPKWYLKFFGGNVIQKTILNTTFKAVGFQRRKWLHVGKVTHISDQERQAALEKIFESI